MTPQCIVFDDYEAGTIKMTGFGYHTLLEQNATSQFDSYFHPAEKFTNGEVYGALTDIWSVGCIAYFMLTGKGLTGFGKNQDDIAKDLDLLLAQKEISEEANEFIKLCLLPLEGDKIRRTAEELMYDKWIKDIKSTTLTPS